MLHHTKSCQQVLPLGSAPAALAPRPCLQLRAPSLHGSGTCRVFPHWSNFPARVAAPVPGQPEVPQLGAPVCRSCSQGQPDSAEQHHDQNRHNPKEEPSPRPGAGSEGLQPCSSGKDTQESLECPSRGPSMEGRQEQDNPQQSSGHCGWGQQGSCLSLGTTRWEQPGAGDCVPHRDTGCCIQDSRETPAQKTLPGRETLEQLQAQRNTMQCPHICLNWDSPSPTLG